MPVAHGTHLRATELGRSGMEITRVGFGAWAIGGGGWEFGWGPQEDDASIASIASIHRALELGVNWIDTAAAHGFGRSEQVVGRAIEGVDRKPYIFTKCSLLNDGTGHLRHNLKREWVLREAEASVKRLGVDAIDLYQIHWPNPEPDIEEGWAALAELKAQGLMRHIGVSNFGVEQLRRIQDIAPVETIQPPYSLVDPAAEDEILPYAEHEGIGAIVYSPMGSGLLTGALTRERIAAMPEDDWAHDGRAVHRTAALPAPRAGREAARHRRAARRDARRSRSGLDAHQPGRRRRDHRLTPPGPGRPGHRRGEPRTYRAGPRRDRDRPQVTAT